MVLERETTDALERWRGAPLHPGFRERFAVRAVLSTPFRGAQAGGRLFWLDRPGLNSDDLVLAQVVAVQVAPLLDQVVLQRRLREAAVDHERVRLARDLHDGLLQSLAAMSLRIQAARDLGRTDPPAACARLGGPAAGPLRRAAGSSPLHPAAARGRAPGRRRGGAARGATAEKGPR